MAFTFQIPSVSRSIEYKNKGEKLVMAIGTHGMRQLNDTAPASNNVAILTKIGHLLYQMLLYSG